MFSDELMNLGNNHYSPLISQTDRKQRTEEQVKHHGDIFSKIQNVLQQPNFFKKVKCMGVGGPLLGKREEEEGR